MLLTIPACTFATHFVAPHLHPFVQLRRRSNREPKPVGRPFNPSGWITLSQVEERDKLAACKEDSDESDGSSDDEEPEDFFDPPYYYVTTFASRFQALLLFGLRDLEHSIAKESSASCCAALTVSRLKGQVCCFYSSEAI